MFTRFKVYIIMFTAFAVFGGVAYWYYQDSQAAIQRYAENQSRLQVALEQQVITTEQLQQDISVMNEIVTDLNEDFAASREQVKELENKFNESANGDERDFGELAAKKPVLVQKIVNTATQEAFECFEQISKSTTKGVDSEELNKCIGNVDSSNSVQ